MLSTRRNASHAGLGLVACVALLLAGRAHADPVVALMRVLRSADDYKQRVTAAIGLARKKDLRAVPALIAALEDRHDTVRGVAASALGELGATKATAAVEALLRRTKDPFARSQARRALALLKQRQRGPGQKVPPPPPSNQMEVTGTLGSLEQDAIQQGVDAVLPEASACFGRAFEAAPYLGGKLTMRFRVTTSGKVKWLQLVQSNLGSVDAEQCILAAMKTAVFESPDGGEAEFTMPLTFGGGDPVQMLDPETSDLARRLHRSCKKLLRGTQGQLVPPAGLVVTSYIDGNGSIASVGLSAAGDIPAAFSQQLVDNLKRLKLGVAGTGGYMKLSYRLSCEARRARPR